MLDFIDYSYENLLKIASYIKVSPLLCSDVSLGAMLIWHEGLDLQFAVFHDTFVVKLNYGDEIAFSYPFGADVEGMLDELYEFVKEAGLPFLFFGISEERLEEMKKNPRFQAIRANYDRRWSDYLYSFEEMRTFVGKKFSGQRNHINKFKKTYGEPDFRTLTKADIPAIHKMLVQYGNEHHENADEMEKKELKGTYELLEHFEELGMYGGVMYVEDQVVSFTIGEIVGDRLVIHVEKGLTAYAGVYPTTYHSFMKYMYEKVGDAIHLVNREDDAGDSGLRTSKTQYQPVRLLHKYLVNINSPIAKIEEIPNISFEGGILTAICPEDKANYLALCTDKENNRYWGYDYEEDRYITAVDENTFYDSQAYDYSIGASVTFAVREKADSPLIGETIIYHCNVAKTAEIGGRIAMRHQGKGLGVKAFTATADYAQKVLGVKPIAKCFKQNTNSQKMILASGFHKTGEDETFFYFERSSE